MALIVWNDKIKVGIWIMDTQHQRWIDFINELYEAMRAGKGRNVVGRTLTDMINYTRRHFADEEALMMSRGWMAYADHKRLHDAFAAKVVILQQRFQAGEMAISVEVMGQLRIWLINHIQTEDRRVAAFLASQGVR
jgi:hemerythrin-like metal-binding protein